MNEKMNKLTCVILNFNSYDIVKKLINEIKNYTIFDYILIVDNVSTDNSYEKLKNDFSTSKKIIVKQTKRNGGYGYGNNFGINYAYKKLGSNFVLICNPDVHFKETMIKKLFEFIKNSGAAIVSGVQLLNQKQASNRAWKLPHPYQWVWNEFAHKTKKSVKDLYYDTSFFTDYASQVECVPGAMLMINAKLFLDVGGYDENMFLYCEEETIGYKLKEKGYSTWLLNDLYYDHQHSASINRVYDSYKQSEFLHKSKLYFMKNYLKTPLPSRIIIKILFGGITTKQFIVGKIRQLKDGKK